MLKTLHTGMPTLVTTNTKICCILNNSIIILLMYILHDHDVSTNTNTLSHIHMHTHTHTCCGVPNARGRFGIKYKSLTMWIVCILLGASSFLVILYTMNNDSSSFVGGRDLNNNPNVQYNNTYTL